MNDKKIEKTTTPAVVEKVFVEGVKSVVEGEKVYRRSDGMEMMVTGVRVSFIDKYGARVESSYNFIELGK